MSEATVETLLPRHAESRSLIGAPVEQVFAHLDDHARLSSHMGEPSLMLGGGRLHVELDEGRGQRVGSRIRMAGRAFGMPLAVEEVVVDRRPPKRKVWKTTGSPRLLVIGPYRMGFELAAADGGSLLRVFIDYALPEKGFARWLGRLFGNSYADWCTRRMAEDARRHFSAWA